MLQAFNTSLPVFLVIGIGWLLRRFKIFGKGEAQTLGGIGFYVGLPALLFRSMANLRLEARDLFFGAVAVIACYLIALLAAMAFSKITGQGRGQAIALALLSSNGNHAYIGLPIVGFAFSGATLAMAAYLTGVLGFWFSVLTVTIKAVYGGTGKEGRPYGARAIGLELSRNPLLIAVVAGLLFRISGLKLPLFADRSLALLEQVAAPAGLLSVGISMNLSAVGRQAKSIIAASAFKLIMAPLLAFLVLKATFPSEHLLQAGVMLLSTPSAASAYFVARMLGGDEELTANSIAITTGLSLITITLILGLFR